MILTIKNAIPTSGPAAKAPAAKARAAHASGPAAPPAAEPVGGVSGRIARRSVAKRESEYAEEVRRLLDAALDLMRTHGTGSRPRVADIVAAAGLSNDAFYRHFKSKDALVTAILEDGSERLRRYLVHQMAKESTPEGQVRRWVKGVLAQADAELSATSLAVLWNGGSADAGLAAGRHFASAPLATLLAEPFAALGSRSPDLDAALAAHAALGLLSDCVWRQKEPTRAEIERVATFCLGAVTP
jgi:AcrR family transcriptional regulator